MSGKVIRGASPQPTTLESTTVIVREMTDGDACAWDRFVFATDGTTFFHRAGWKSVLNETFGLRPHYLIAEREGQIVGVLPLFLQKSLLFGNALVSIPFGVEGGPVATNTAALSALDRAALALMEQTHARFLEYRIRGATRPGWQAKRELYATFARDLSADDDKNLLAIPRKQRAVVRKTLASSLASEVDPATDRLYRIYSESVRNLGTPMFPRSYFPALLKAFEGDCDIVVILDDGAPVSAVMNFYFKGCVMPYYGGGTAGARRSGANDFLYWEVMRRAAARGFRRFDFGRSKANTGAFAFKKNWGFDPEWLEYEYYLSPGQSLPEKNPLNPKYALLIAAWKRLPLPIANAIGPLLIAGLG